MPRHGVFHTRRTKVRGVLTTRRVRSLPIPFPKGQRNGRRARRSGKAKGSGRRRVATTRALKQLLTRVSRSPRVRKLIAFSKKRVRSVRRRVRRLRKGQGLIRAGERRGRGPTGGRHRGGGIRLTGAQKKILQAVV